MTNFFETFSQKRKIFTNKGMNMTRFELAPRVREKLNG